MLASPISASRNPTFQGLDFGPAHLRHAAGPRFLPYKILPLGGSDLVPPNFSEQGRISSPKIVPTRVGSRPPELCRGASDLVPVGDGDKAFPVLDMLFEMPEGKYYVRIQFTKKR